MATPTTTTATTTIAFASCAAESEASGDAWYGFAPLYRAYLACRRGKRATRKAQRYELDLLDHLVDTADALQSHAWRPSRAIRFVVTHPKPREILAASFADRVVHHLLVPQLERLYEPVFIHDSYANRRGKGSHAAVRRLQHFLRADRGVHYLQLDVANFFNRIHRRTLFGLLRSRIQRDARRAPGHPRHVSVPAASQYLWLARVLLTGNRALNAVFHGRPEDLARVPEHKRLAHAPPEYGLPIGNLTSQFFANVYLNELDQFVKHRLKARRYVRYVDDFVLLHEDPAQLRQWHQNIEAFLDERLGLALRDAGRLAPASDGIDFLGYIVRADYMLVRRRVVGHLRDKLQGWQRRVVQTNGRLYCAPADVDRLQAMLASYLGHFRHARSRRLQQALWQQHAWLHHWLAWAGDGRLQRVDRPPAPTSLAAQWRWFRWRYPRHALIMRVGSRWECQAGPQARRTTRRPGLPPTCSLPSSRLSGLRRWLRARRQPWCEINENGHLPSGLKRRQLVAVMPVPSVPVLNPIRIQGNLSWD